MSRARGTKQYQPLNQGLITEASPLDFPQGATIDELNFRFEHRGNRRVKRKGLKQRKQLDYTLQHYLDPESVRTGKPYYWKKYGLTVLPLILKFPTFTISEIHFYDDAGALKGSFPTAGDISTPIRNVEEADYAVEVIKVDDERIVINVNYLSAVFFADIEQGGASVRCSQGLLYSRDFATLSTDDDPYARKTIVDGTPPVDVNYEYNIANAGWIKDYLTISQAGSFGSNPLDAVLSAWVNDNSIKYPAMGDDVNSYIVRDASTEENPAFDVDKYQAGKPKGFLSGRGSQILSNDSVLGGRDQDAPTTEARQLTTLLEFFL